MSNTLTQLTWDNLEEWCAALPRDENGHIKNQPVLKKPIFPLLGPFDSLCDKLGFYPEIKFKESADQSLAFRFPTICFETATYDVTCALLSWFDRDSVKGMYEAVANSLSVDQAAAVNTIYSHVNLVNNALIHLSANSIPIEGVKLKHFVGDKVKTVVFTANTKLDPGVVEYEVAVEDDGDNVSMSMESVRDLTIGGIITRAEKQHTQRVDAVIKAIDTQKAELEYDPLLRAQRGLESLDVEEAEKEFAVAAQSMQRNKELKENGLAEILDSPLNNPDMTPEQLEAWRLKRIEKASGIVATMDAMMEAGGRLKVDDKTLMNCNADLNQLIPFKYNWAWSLYLTSSASHWMPMETEVGDCQQQYLALDTSIKKIMARMWLTHLSRKQLFPESILLNIYRQATNPECRQYLLRQGQEMIVLNHAWLEFNDALNIKDTLIGSKNNAVTPAQALVLDDDAFKRRHRLVKLHAAHLHDYTTTTETTEKLAAFVKAFIILYTHTNFLMPVVSHYQTITALEFNETCQPVAAMLQKMNRDTMAQWSFATTFIAGVIAENQDIVTKEWQDDIHNALNELIECELELVSTLTAGETDYFDVSCFCNHFKDEMMSIVDSSHVRTRHSGDHTRGMEFIQVLNQLAPAIDHSAGLGSISW